MIRGENTTGNSGIAVTSVMMMGFGLLLPRISFFLSLSPHLIISDRFYGRCRCRCVSLLLTAVFHSRASIIISETAGCCCDQPHCAATTTVTAAATGTPLLLLLLLLLPVPPCYYCYCCCCYRYPCMYYYCNCYYYYYCCYCFATNVSTSAIVNRCVALLINQIQYWEKRECIR
eukprot:GHVU01027183.1.p1 GENE.GHVU01027183.1~~GHVU01027183.1.p1  ORF type:complete len:174 (-),score=8.67 GHVU01027183.1:1075-1596(-)